ncbi:ABC transporter ATP-binding protein [Arthrobacter sp. 179]|uniref:ABC transporter ATP-binding protein n=1 Tax=Arthrobacter sp. 179 TaxID=3457734 RepID=UPI0040338860
MAGTSSFDELGKPSGGTSGMPGSVSPVDPGTKRRSRPNVLSEVSPAGPVGRGPHRHDQRRLAADRIDIGEPERSDKVDGGSQPDADLIKPDAQGRQPVVVVDDLHVTYKVFSSGKKAGKAGLRRLMSTPVRGLRSVEALRGVSFAAYQNESIGIIGPNGSGKSTLMRALVGLTPPSQGAVYASSRPNLLGIGAALMPDLSGDKNITLGGLALGFSRQEIEELREEIITFAELEDFIDLPMRTYSSGMSARLKFAIAAAKQHDILIVDEALAVGDARFHRRSEAKIRAIRENAGTVFHVSHSMKSIKDTCNRALWINQGKLEMDGEPAEVIAAYREWRK